MSVRRYIIKKNTALLPAKQGTLKMWITFFVDNLCINVKTTSEKFSQNVYNYVDNLCITLLFFIKKKKVTKKKKYMYIYYNYRHLRALSAFPLT